MKTFMKRKNAFILSIFTIFTISIFSFSDRFMRSVEAHLSIPYSINWSNTNLITMDNVWDLSNLDLRIRGYSGADIPVAPGTDARTVLPDSTILNVKANQTNPDTLVEGGVAEFEIANPTIALKGSDTAHAPYINVLVRTTGFNNIRFRANIRDLSTVNDAVQQVAVQYRIDETPGTPFIDVPGAYIADATQGGTATLVTPIDLILPAGANNAADLEIRVMTINAIGEDEWIGVDDISVTGTSNPTAATVSLSGKVTDGRRGIANATVQLTSQDGTTQAVRTNFFGNFRFDEVAAGEMYVITVQAKRFRFNPLIINVTEDLEGINFVAQQQLLKNSN
ncbi:MAG: carboxypeptidase-like regulatory domain-containing protein [Acidobacteriota bacterium]|nr:carboxypeptidase-like regulatory domain-containing protein [Acidobacteriota bacterium]